MFGDLPIRGVLIFAAIAVAGCLGLSAMSNSLGGSQTAAAIARPSKSPVVVATNPFTPAPSSTQRTPTPSTSQPEPAATPQGPWFWAKEVTSSDETSAFNNLRIEVTSAQFGALTASTDRDATCVASGTYPSGAPIVSSGLGQTSADASGFVRWRFSASPAERGRASYLFTCFTSSDRRTFEVLFDIP